MTRSRRPKASPPDPSAAPAAATLGDVLAAEPALACLVFSFLPNARDRCALARVGRVFRDADARVASLPAAFDRAERGFISGDAVKYLMRHDGVLSLPKARVEELLASVTRGFEGKTRRCRSVWFRTHEREGQTFLWLGRLRWRTRAAQVAARERVSLG
jgi:hypothetical protein